MNAQQRLASSMEGYLAVSQGLKTQLVAQEVMILGAENFSNVPESLRENSQNCIKSVFFIIWGQLFPNPSLNNSIIIKQSPYILNFLDPRNVEEIVAN